MAESVSPMKVRVLAKYVYGSDPTDVQEAGPEAD